MAKYKLENNPLFGLPAEEKIAEDKPSPLPLPAVREEITEKPRRGRPQNGDLVRGVSVQEGLTQDYTRATFIMRVDLVEKLKNYAYTERLSMKDAVNMLMADALRREESRLEKQGQRLLDRNGGK